MLLMFGLLGLALGGAIALPLLALAVILHDAEEGEDTGATPERPLYRLRERILLRWDNTRRLR